MSWQSILKEDLTEKVRNALELIDKDYAEDTIQHHGVTKEGIANIIDDLEASMLITNPHPIFGMIDLTNIREAIKTLKKLL